MDEYQQQLEAYISDGNLPPEFDVSFRSVFGARAAYANGHIFASCGQFGFAIKLPSDVCARLFELGSAIPLKYFAKGHVKKNYAVLNTDDPNIKPQLADLLAQSVRFVQPEALVDGIGQ